MHGDRRRTGTSVADAHDHRPALSLDLGKEGRIVFGIDPGFADQTGLGVGQMFSKPVLHLGQEAVTIVKAGINQVDRLALERLQAGAIERG
jgi:hypothetical protein